MRRGSSSVAGALSQTLPTSHTSLAQLTPHSKTGIQLSEPSLRPSELLRGRSGEREEREERVTHLSSPGDGDGTRQEVPNDVLQGHTQSVHVDGIDQTQAVLERKAQRS